MVVILFSIKILLLLLLIISPWYGIIKIRVLVFVYNSKNCFMIEWLKREYPKVTARVTGLHYDVKTSTRSRLHPSARHISLLGYELR